MERLERVLCGQMSTGWKTISVSSVCVARIYFYTQQPELMLHACPIRLCLLVDSSQKEKGPHPNGKPLRNGLLSDKISESQSSDFLLIKVIILLACLWGCYAPRDGKVKRELRRKGSQRGHRKRQFVEGRSPFLLA